MYVQLYILQVSQELYIGLTGISGITRITGIRGISDLRVLQVLTQRWIQVQWIMYLSCIAYAMYHRYYKKQWTPKFLLTLTLTYLVLFFICISFLFPLHNVFKSKINKCTNISDHSGRLDQAPLKCLYQLVGINFSFYYRYGRDCESYSWLTLKSCPDVVTSCFLLQAPSLTESLNYSLVL